jgi:hypothetical protein
MSARSEVALVARSDDDVVRGLHRRTWHLSGGPLSGFGSCAITEDRCDSESALAGEGLPVRLWPTESRVHEATRRRRMALWM